MWSLSAFVDVEARTKAREHIKAQFAQHRLERDGARLEELLATALEVRTFLDESVVQVEQEGSQARVHLRPTTHLTRNVDMTDVISDDLTWAHEKDAAIAADASCATPGQKCAGCACQ